MSSRPNVTRRGATIKAEQQIEKRERLTRKKRWERQDEDEQYTASQLDRDVVNPDQIRTVVRRSATSCRTYSRARGGAKDAHLRQDRQPR